MYLKLVTYLTCALVLAGCGNEQEKRIERKTIDGFKQFKFGSSIDEVTKGGFCSFRFSRLPYIGVEALECSDYLVEGEKRLLSLLFIKNRLARIVLPSAENEEAIISVLKSQYGPQTFTEKRSDKIFDTLFANGAVKLSKTIGDNGEVSNVIVYSVLDYTMRRKAAENEVVSSITNGHYNFNKSMTIGNALNGWSSECSNTEWEAFAAPRGITGVKYSCSVRDLREWTRAAKKYLKSEQQRGMNVGADVFESTEVENIKNELTWLLNVDGSAQLESLQYVLKWKDGRQHIEENSKEMGMALLKNFIYPNKARLGVSAEYMSIEEQVVWVFERSEKSMKQ